MKPYYSLTAFAIYCLVSLFSGCTLDPDRKLNDAIQQYNEKKPNAFQVLEKEFVYTISVDSVGGSNFQTNGSLLYKIKDNNAEIFYPVKETLTLTDGDAIKSIDHRGEYAVISDGLQFCIFDSDGNHRNDETIGDKKNQVKAVCIDGDDIIFYKNQKIFRYSIVHKSSDQLLKETFPPPYANYYQVRLDKHDDLLTVLAGIAGSYYFSIINLSNGSVLIKNTAMSSSKYHMSSDTIRYITGNSGNWEMMQYSIDTKTKKSLGKLTDIVDIELTGQGYVLLTSTGLWVSEYGKERKRIPFSYDLAGKYKGRVLLSYKDTYYFIDMKKMLGSLAKLSEKTPDLFSKTK